MKMITTEKLLNLLIQLGLGLTAITLLAMPLIVTAYFKSAYQLLDDPVITAVIIGVYICALPYVWALVNLSVLSNMIIDTSPFTQKSIDALKWIAICSFSEIVIIPCVTLFIKNRYDFFADALIVAPLTIIMFLCLVIALLCFTLSKLFDTAREFKLENDMTI